MIENDRSCRDVALLEITQLKHLSPEKSSMMVALIITVPALFF